MRKGQVEAMSKEIIQCKLAYGKDWPVFVRVGTYRDGSLAINLFCANDEDYGEPFTDMTKCVGDKMPLYCATVKNYSENEGMVDFLLLNGFGELDNRVITSGFVSMPVFRFDRVRLQGLDTQGCERYEGLQRKFK